MKKRLWAVMVACLPVLLIGVAGVLVLSKIVNVNQYMIRHDSIKGIDVSHYQGVINWEAIASQNVDFAFIKATEGSNYVDDTFKYNWSNASQYGIVTGAYHFFSIDSAVESQAQKYIDTVGDLSGHFAPVIDAEFYGDKEANPPVKEVIVASLHSLLSLLEQEYQVKPIIYTTYKFYNCYLRDDFTDYPIWIRNVYYPPFDIGRDWTFWQYSDRGELSGMQGEERYVDLNVFSGDRDEINNYLCY